MKKIILSLCALLLLLSLHGQRDISNSDITKLVLLGTGNPNPDPQHSGCALLLLVRDVPYVIDFGPGLVRQAAALTPRYGGSMENFSISELKTAFLTHLHSDHTTGYPDLILNPWVMGRDEALSVYGPEGVAHMTEKILEAYEEDIRYRLYGDEPANNQGWRVDCHEFVEEGEIYRDSNITVEAFPVLHGSWPNAWGFRFTTPDKVIVVSGDTAPTETIARYASGADILVHEVYSQAGFEKKSPDWQAYHRVNHTSTLELGKLAEKCRPAKVLLYHILDWGSTEEELLEEIHRHYKGEVFVGRDLDIH